MLRVKPQPTIALWQLALDCPEDGEMLREPLGERR